MSREDKIGALVLGLLLFSGLFYFIYTTMKNPLPSEFGDEAYFDETYDDLDEELLELDGEESAAPAEAAVTPEAEK